MSLKYTNSTSIKYHSSKNVLTPKVNMNSNSRQRHSNNRINRKINSIINSTSKLKCKNMFTNTNESIKILNKTDYKNGIEEYKKINKTILLSDLHNPFFLKTNNELSLSLHTNSNHYYKKNIIKRMDQDDLLRYYQNEGRKYSLSYQKNKGNILFKKIIKDTNDYINERDNRSNKILCYTTRGKNRMNINYNERNNATKNMLKTMKKSLDRNIMRLKKEKSLKNNIYKSNFINYNINSKGNNNKINNNSCINSHYIINNLSPSYKNKMNHRLLNYTTNFINSMKEERNTSKFIKELSKKKNIDNIIERFTYDKENHHINDNFYLSPSRNDIKNDTNFNYFKKANFIRKKNCRKLKSFKTFNQHDNKIIVK